MATIVAPSSNFPLQWLRRDKLTEFEAVLFGFTLVLGYRYVVWNVGLAYGYNLLVTNTIYVGSGFLCLCLCLGEMTSALPFSGGIFGFVRASTGPYYGFIVACFEIVFCLGFIPVIMYKVVSIPVITGAVNASFTPYLIVIAYFAILLPNLVGGKPLWMIIALIGCLISLLLIIFFFGIIADSQNQSSTVSFTHYCQSSQRVTFLAMMENRWSTNSQYLGLQFLPLLSEYVPEPTKSMPRILIICATTATILSILVALTACSVAPGGGSLATVLTPLMFSFQRIFNTSLTTGIWLHLPAVIGPVLTMLYCCGRQIYTIAKSGLLPVVFTQTTPLTETPLVTLLLGAVLGIALNLTIYYQPIAYAQIINIIEIAYQFIFVNAFVAYLFFRRKYSSLSRPFTSPLGIWGAYYGLVNNLWGLVSVILYEGAGNSRISLSFFGIFLFLASLFYWGYLVKRQSFSEEEKKLLFKAYLINANQAKRKRICRNNKVANAPAAPSASNANSNSNNNSTSHHNHTNTNSNIAKKTSRLSLFPPPLSSSNGNTITNSSSNNNNNSNNNVMSSRGTNSSSFTPREVGSSQKPNNNNNNQNTAANQLLLVAKDNHLPAAASLSAKSSKLLQFLSSKFNAVAPYDLEEYQQMAVLAAGGVLEASEEEALQERFGLNDVEAGEMEQDHGDEGEQGRPAEAVEDI